MVLWLFVLVPMLVSKRDAVRRTSDVALATRVLNGGANSRLIKRSGPAAGHRSDPDWQPPEDSADTDLDEEHDLAENGDDRETDDDADTDELSRRRPVVMKMAVTEPAEADEPDYLDVDVVEDSAALPVGASDSAAEDIDEEPAEDDVDTEAVAKHDDEDRYEYVEDSSGLEPPPKTPTTTTRFQPRCRAALPAGAGSTPRRPPRSAPASTRSARRS
ncbi:putative conserved transmembrane protein [Mycobacterium intracellulare 1956]|uniref:Putative conserved transmembrane protein n=1 Tax=Mycobacterium intracellulare 1956 TaxID=1299331 RepID=X8CNQ6_MYCIT|nr:putative conserved transmembrane protein [Mycobacterium intracellulare 1956]